MSEPTYAARCIRCDKSFTDSEIEGHESCPSCGTTCIPSDPAHDVNITINTHELRILGIWAENYAVSVDNQHLDDVAHDPLKPTVAAIAARLEKQLKAQGKPACLTLSSEIRALSKEYPGTQLFRDGVEEIIDEDE